MRFSARSKVGVLLSLVTILTLVSAFAVTIVSRGSATHASTVGTAQASPVQTFTTRNLTVPSSMTGIRNPVSPSSTKNLPTRDMGVRTPGRSSQTSSGVHAASVSSSLTTQNQSNMLLHNFNGLSDLNNSALNPFIAEPPDQGICAGYLLDQSTGKKIPMEYEMVNDIIAIYLPGGNLVVEQNLETFFGEANFSSSGGLLVGDARCHFDRLTHTFFFTATVIGQDQYLPPSSKSHLDIAWIDANTPQTGREILVDTTDAANASCPCYADYPTFGLDNNAVYVAYNEFPIASGGSFQGARLDVFSKSQMVNKAPVVNGFPFAFSPLIFALQPAINVSSSNSEYLENSFSYDESGNPIPTSNVLALWHVTNDQNIAGKVPPIVHNAKLITVESYSFPVAATSTGTGVTDSNGFTSAAFLNPDDDRLQQVEGIQDEGQIELWSSLDTAVSIKGDTQVRDGIAWFRIDPANVSVAEQGYIASSGNNLLYPAILHSNNGTTAIVFTITSTTRNPSAAYVLSPSSPTNFGSTINIAAQGANPYLTATNRWGDYSAAELALDGDSIWLATEYVPVQTSTTFYLNWGTDVFEVSTNN